MVQRSAVLDSESRDPPEGFQGSGGGGGRLRHPVGPAGRRGRGARRARTMHVRGRRQCLRHPAVLAGLRGPRTQRRAAVLAVMSAHVQAVPRQPCRGPDHRTLAQQQQSLPPESLELATATTPSMLAGPRRCPAPRGQSKPVRCRSKRAHGCLRQAVEAVARRSVGCSRGRGGHSTRPCLRLPTSTSRVPCCGGGRLCGSRYVRCRCSSPDRRQQHLNIQSRAPAHRCGRRLRGGEKVMWAGCRTPEPGREPEGDTDTDHAAAGHVLYTNITTPIRTWPAAARQ